MLNQLQLWCMMSSYYWVICVQNMTDEVPQEKEYRLHSIRNLYAFDLFCQHRFEDSLNIFTQLGTGLWAPLAISDQY